MPELPEVERGRRLAESHAEGRRIVSVWCAEDDIVFAGTPPAEVVNALTGRRVEAVCRWGKQLWFELDRAPHPLFHFGMSGAFRAPGDAPLQLKSGPLESAAWPPRFARIVLGFDDGGALAMTDGRRLGRIRLRELPRCQPPISTLGFDPLLSMLPPGAFARAIRPRKGAIKSLLLDQSFVAGIGNWLADEVLYQARINPRRPASSLTTAESRALARVIRRVVRRAVSADGDDARYPRAWLFHHRWGRVEGARTAKGEPIDFITVGGRTTAWVPSAQEVGCKKRS